MPFLRFQDGHNEWGMHVPNGCIPGVGDNVTLQFGYPDKEAHGCVDATIMKRDWLFEDDEIFIDVKTLEKLPRECIASSPEWPSEEYTKRRQETELEAKRIARKMKAKEIARRILNQH